MSTFLMPVASSGAFHSGAAMTMAFGMGMNPSFSDMSLPLSTMFTVANHYKQAGDALMGLFMGMQAPGSPAIHSVVSDKFKRKRS